MKIIAKIAFLLVLIITVFSFSGCSIRRAEEKVNDVKSDVKKQEEAKKVDSDGDGLFDWEEEKWGTDKNKPDTDGDGLTDYEEIKKWKTNPKNPDTDGDGYSDGQEVQKGYNPNGTGQLDSDNDGLGDADEKKIGTDPNKFDTEGDGFSDKEEIDRETDPLKAD